MGQSFCRRRAGESGTPKVDVSEKSAAVKSESNRASASKAKVLPPKPAATLRSSNKRVDGKTSEEWKAAGNESIKNGNHAAAYEAYCKGLQADPDNAMLYSNRALCLEKLGRKAEAVEDAKRCIELRPDFVKGFLRAAQNLRDLGEPQEALDILRKAPSHVEVEQMVVALKPEAAKAEKTRLSSMGAAERLKEEGNAIYKKGFFEQALDVYGKALNACKDKRSELALAIHNNRAGCYHQLSDFHAVVKETNVVLEAQPDNLKALMRRALALEPLEKYEEALADARHVIRLNPGNEVANKLQHRLGKLCRDRERANSAATA